MASIAFSTYLVVLVSVVGDEGVGPEVVDAKGAHYHVGVVELMVVANPRSDESPEGLHPGVGAHSRCLLWLAT